MNKKGLLIISGVFILSVATFFYLLDSFGLENILEIFYRVKIWHILVIIGMMLIHFIVFCMRWQRILKAQGFNVSLKNLLVYRLAGFSVAYLTPAADFGGEPIMAYLLSKENKGLKMTGSFASVVSNRVMDLTVNLSIILISFLYVMAFFVLPENLTFLFYITLAIAITLMVLMYRLFLKKKNPLHRVFSAINLYKFEPIYKRKQSIKEFDDILNKFFHNNGKELSIHLFLSIITAAVMIAIFWVLAQFLNFNITILDSMVGRAIDTIAMSAIPVPANIGAGEAGESALFEMIGVGAASGFSFYLIYRSKDIFFSLLGLGFLFTRGVWDEIVGILKKAFEEKGM